MEQGDRAEARCRACTASFVAEPASAGLCPECRTTTYPPITERAGRWSPLALGGLSIVCDILLIPSILAIVRGFGELREVARRERAGLYRDEHPSVRSGAVWGIALGAVRPLAMVVLFVTMFAAVAVGHPNREREPVSGPTELEEVVALLLSGDSNERELGARQLDAIAVDLEAEDVETLLSTAETDPRCAGDDLEAFGARGQLVRAATVPADREALWLASALDVERLAALYPRVSGQGKRAVLDALATRGTSTALSRLADLVMLDHRGELPPPLPMSLLAQSAYPSAFLPALLDSEFHRSDAVHLAAMHCDRDPDVDLGASGGSLLAAWRDLEPMPPARRGWSRLDHEPKSWADAAADRLTALSCIDDPAIDPILEEATGASDPRVAVAAVEGLLRRGVPVSRRVIARLAADPLSRAELVDAAVRFGGVTDIPLRWRRTDAMAEADAARWLAAQGREVASVEVLGDELRGAEAAIVEVAYRDGGAHTLVLRPYPPSGWARDPDALEVQAIEPAAHGGGPIYDAAAVDAWMERMDAELPEVGR